MKKVCEGIRVTFKGELIRTLSKIRIMSGVEQVGGGGAGREEDDGGHNDYCWNESRTKMSLPSTLCHTLRPLRCPTANNVLLLLLFLAPLPSFFFCS